MNGIRNTLAAALVLALAAPAAAGAQTAPGDRDDALSGHPVEEDRDLPGSDSPLSTGGPGDIADTSDRGIVPELDPLRDLDEPIPPGVGEGNAPGSSILDPGDGGGSILPD